ncbi:MAG: hypothetical protein RRA35_01455 [Desulfomonilia bacterium]|nr:hypothetical protein [Desulfomonilia bacterium]
MWKLQISLFGILFVVIFVEATVIPHVWSPLRVDLFIGMIIGLIIHTPYSQGFPFVILASLFLQAFSGARLGYLPLLYVFTYLCIDLLKNIVYLENVFTQLTIGFLFFLVTTTAVVASVQGSIIDTNLGALLFGAVLTGSMSPIMATLVRHLKSTYES